MSLSGAVSLAIGVINDLLESITSPLIHNVSQMGKIMIQSCIAYQIWGNKATIESIAGIICVAIGCGIFPSAGSQSFIVKENSKQYIV